MYGDSHALSSDSTPISPSTPNPSKQEEEHQFPLMESQYSNTTQNSSGLLRFRSAPTSLLSNFTEKTSKLGFSRFSDETNGVMNVAENEEDDDDDDGCNNKGSFSRFGGVNSQLPPQYPRQRESGGYRVVSSIGRENQGLVRQNSSPAGLFSHLNSQNGYSGVRSVGNYRVASDGDLSPSSNRFKNHMNFSSNYASPSSLRTLSQISEFEHESGLDEAKVGNSSSGGDNLIFSSGFPFGSWNDSSYFAENVTSTGIKREVDNDPKLFRNSGMCENGNRPNILSHHLILPKSSSSEMAAMEKLLQLQDTVPCKVRAKRGCATHPLAKPHYKLVGQLPLLKKICYLYYV